MTETKTTMNFLSGLAKPNEAPLETARELTRDVTIEIVAGTTEVGYTLYRRRWYGVLIWVLTNLMTSWAWITYSSISSVSAKFYNVSENAVNNFSIAYMGCLCGFCPVVIWLMHHIGFRVTFLIGSGGLTMGSWLRYAGSRTSPPSYAVTLVGQVILGMSGAVPLSLPSHYTNLWFGGNSKVAANAIMSLSNPTGAALAQLIGPAIVSTKNDIPSLLLYIALICSGVTALSTIVPAKPPTPPSMSSEEEKIDPRTAIISLAKSPRFWLFSIPFITFVGFFNAISSLLFQIMSPYGVSSDISGYLGAALIGCGLVAATTFSPIIDKFQVQLISMKMIAPIIGVCYVVFIWIPGQPIVAAYLVLGALGGASFTLLPITLEWLANDSRPISPEVSSSLCWMGGQLLGILFTLIMQSLKSQKSYGDPSVPDGDMTRALIFQGVVSMTFSLLPLLHWFFRDRDVTEIQIA